MVVTRLENVAGVKPRGSIPLSSAQRKDFMKNEICIICKEPLCEDCHYCHNMECPLGDPCQYLLPLKIEGGE